MSKRVYTDTLVIWEEVLMMLLALVSGCILVIQLTTQPGSLEEHWLNGIDLSIALIFLAEFAVRFFHSSDSTAYLKRNWWYLLASIPVTTPATEALRLLRLFRLFRLMTGMKAVDSYIQRFLKQTYILYVMAVWVIIVFCGTITFYELEHAWNTHVRNVFDSLWYVIATITTVGYGDIYPTTTGGRIIGMILMLVGIGTSGVLTALIASFLVKQSQASHS